MTNLQQAEWDVGAIINSKLAPALDGYTASIGIVAMLTFCLLIIKPDLTADEAEKGVQKLSGCIFEFLESLDAVKPEMN